MANQISNPNRATAADIQDNDYYVFDRTQGGTTYNILGSTLKQILAKFEAGAGTNSIKDKRATAAAGEDATAIGQGASAAIDKTTNITGAHIIQKAAAITDADAFQLLSGAYIIITSEIADLKTTGAHTIVFPTGIRMFVDEVGVIATNADTVSVNPTISFGTTGTNDLFLVATEITGLSVAGARNRQESLSSDRGVDSLVYEITAGATATTLEGRAYFKGFILEDE